MTFWLWGQKIRYMDENGLNESTSVVEILTLIKTAGKRECCMYLFEKSTLNITDSSLFYCMLNHMEYRMLCWWHPYGGRETSMHCKWRRAPADREGIGCCRCSQHNQIKKFICRLFLFLYLFALCAFAAHVLSNWLKVFS